MSKELKPCPVCGEVGVVHVTEYHAMEAENAALRDRIDVLEWLREVEEADRTMSEWHPDKWKRDKGANRRRGDARAAVRRMWRNARAAVEP